MRAFLAALLLASPASAQLRTQAVPVQVPGVPGAAAAGAAAGVVRPAALSYTPSLALPSSVLPALAPSAPLAALERAARGAAAARQTLPTAALGAPALETNAAKPQARRQTFAEMVEQLKAEKAAREAPPVLPARLAEVAEAIGWKAGAPALAKTVAVDAIGARFGTLFDGALQRDAAPVAVDAAPKASDAALPRDSARSAAVPQAAPAGVAGPALLGELRAQTRRGHQGHSYDEAKSFLFTDADSVQVNGERGVADAYSGVFVPGRGGDGGRYRERGDQDGDGYVESHGMNVEHIWPQSYFNERSPMRGDLHHLMATFQHPNSMRGRLPFGEVPDGRVEYHNRFGARMGAGLFEPPDSAKGRVARAMLYFMTRYGDQGVLPRGVVNHFWNARVETLLKWNRMFPPSEFERRRNDIVEKYQGNRNPFVDDHTLADRVGVEGFLMQGGGSSSWTEARGAEVRGRSQGLGGATRPVDPAVGRSANPYKQHKHRHGKKHRRR